MPNPSFDENAFSSDAFDTDAFDILASGVVAVADFFYRRRRRGWTPLA